MANKGIFIVAENPQIFEFSIHDVDIASEMVGYTRSQILSHAGIAILAQANVQMQSVLQLLA
jgi:flagellin